MGNKETCYNIQNCQIKHTIKKEMVGTTENMNW